MIGLSVIVNNVRRVSCEACGSRLGAVQENITLAKRLQELHLEHQIMAASHVAICAKIDQKNREVVNLEKANEALCKENKKWRKQVEKLTKKESKCS